MRIWIINHYAVPPTFSGGTRHFNFAQQLIRRGHEVTIIAANYNHFSHEYMLTPNTSDKVDTSTMVPFIWIPVPKYKGNTIARFWNMLVFSRRLLQKKYLPRKQLPDIIIGSSPHLFAALGAQYLAKHLKKPFILEIRDIWPDTLVDLGKFTAKHPLIKIMKYIEIYLYKNATHIISLLPSAHIYLAQCGVDSKRILWLPNTIDSTSFSNVSDYATKKNNPFIIIYAGSHGFANDLDTVISAAKILQQKNTENPIKIYLVGEGPEKQRLKNRVLQEEITLVEFYDALPKNQIYPFLEKGDAFLMLLKRSPVFRWGISPNKLYDYLMMGRPIIFGVETSFNPIQQEKAGISIPPSDPHSLALAMEQMANTEQTELKAMGQRGRNYVIQNHDVSYLANALEKTLQDVHSSYQT